jgi:hypothetical protein
MTPQRRLPSRRPLRAGRPLEDRGPSSYLDESSSSRPPRCWSSRVGLAWRCLAPRGFASSADPHAPRPCLPAAARAAPQRPREGHRTSPERPFTARDQGGLRGSRRCSQPRALLPPTTLRAPPSPPRPSSASAPRVPLDGNRPHRSSARRPRSSRPATWGAPSVSRAARLPTNGSTRDPGSFSGTPITARVGTQTRSRSSSARSSSTPRRAAIPPSSETRSAASCDGRRPSEPKRSSWISARRPSIRYERRLNHTPTRMSDDERRASPSASTRSRSGFEYPVCRHRTLVAASSTAHFARGRDHHCEVCSRLVSPMRRS